MSLTVYKSSAGSGKTYTLVKEYLKLVLPKPVLAGNILAITFTNAASNEMKERIIKALAEIKELKKNNNNNSKLKKTKQFIKEISEEVNIDEKKLIENSEKALFHILHNYNDFNISTIDSFTNKILRSFAFDLKIPVNFDVEFDTNQTIEQAAEILISYAGTKNSNDLTDLLIRFIESRTDEERSFTIEREIVNMAKKMLNEESISFVNKLKEKNIGDFVIAQKNIKKEVDNFKGTIKSIGEEAIKKIKIAGIEVKSLYQSNKGIYSFFNKLTKDEIEDSVKITKEIDENGKNVKYNATPNKYVNQFLYEEKLYGGSASQEQKEAIDKIFPDLKELAEKAIKLFEESLDKYILLKNINNNIFPLALINEMGKIMDNIRKEESILFISDFNLKISDFIAKEPIPYIYERVGEKYQNFMIDEFQDTSVLQWQNLLPLLENSLANGNFSLLVGDAKQSIYRWRGGDARQFVELPKLTDKIYSANKQQIENILKANYKQFPESDEDKTTNYRSSENIVNFNNSFFDFVKMNMPDLIKNVYKGHEQKVFNKDGKGKVDISFIEYTKGEKETYYNNTVEKVYEIIAKLEKGKYNYKDIAILCRKREEAAAVAQHLAGKGLQVVSADSLLLSSSKEINFLISFLKVINNKNDSIALAECLKYLINENLITQPNNLHLCLKEVFSNNDSETIFDRFDNLLINNSIDISECLKHSNTIYELLENIVRVFFKSNKKINPYITFFFDFVYDYQLKRQSYINDFLKLWEDKKNELSIVVPDKLNAVKVITIHKSKGLQFPVVIFPFANEKAKSNINDGFWISNKDKGFSKINNYDLDVAYLSTRKNLQQTSYSEIYEDESQSLYMDMVNNTYVALTRAEERLYILPRKPEAKKSISNDSVHNIICNYLKNKDLWMDDKSDYSFPDKEIKEEQDRKSLKNEEEDSGEEWLKEYINNQRETIISARIPDQPYEYDKIQKLTRGKAVHKAMEQIHSEEDLPFVINQLLHEGFIKEKETLEDNIKSLINNPLIQPFFSKKYYKKTEPGIFDSKGDFYRPDMIAFNNEETAVIDYKTGNRSNKYQKQIKKYAELLKEMNYKNIKMFIIYIDMNEIDEVF